MAGREGDVEIHEHDVGWNERRRLERSWQRGFQSADSRIAWLVTERQFLEAAMPILPVCEQVDDRRDHSASQCFEAGTASTSAYSASCYVGTVNCLVNVQRHETCVSASNS